MVDSITQIELLKQKLALMLRIRDMTASADISARQAEERYITLMSRREAIITQLKYLDTQLKTCLEEEGADNLRRQISEASERIMEMDGQLALRVPDLMKDIKNRLKQINDGKSISRAYHKDVLGRISGGTFNLRK
ncbi:MAG: hypothetical protein LBB94_07850 [Clostridiales bacterium]|jgi:hypothetical protein|nr:hypothetical protein [Clostridiales bacterium]